MKNIIMILLLLSVNLFASDVKTEKEISFPVNGTIMWLVDKNKKFKDLDPTENKQLVAQLKLFEEMCEGEMETCFGDDEYLEVFLEWKKREENRKSVKFFVETVNASLVYKYKNWRVPTKNELLTLEKKNLWILHGRSRDYYTKASIDDEIFNDYDYQREEKYFLSSDRCNSDEIDKKYFAVYYGLYRQKVYACRSTHVCNRENLDNEYGAKVYCINPNDEKSALRLVRDLK